MLNYQRVGLLPSQGVVVGGGGDDDDDDSHG